MAFREPNPGEVPTIVAEDPAAYGGSRNIFKVVNQLEIAGYEKRIPDGILYINGLPLVVFEFKSAIREEASIFDAFIQLTVRYQRDIPELLKYNALSVISDGVNNKVGSLFAPYEFFCSWRKTDGGDLIEKDFLRGDPVAWEQRGEVVLVRHAGQAHEHPLEVGEGVVAVAPGLLDEGVDHRAAPPGVGAEGRRGRKNNFSNRPTNTLIRSWRS